MSLFDKWIKNDNNDDDGEEIILNGNGDEVHVFKDGTTILESHTEYWLPTGEEWCPDCHVLMEHKDGYWECPDCGHSITDEESEYGEGYPTKESTYEDDYDTYYSDDDDDEY